MTPGQGAFFGMATPLAVAAVSGYASGGLICKPDLVGAMIFHTIGFMIVLGIPAAIPGTVIGLAIARSSDSSEGERPGHPPRVPINRPRRHPNRPA